MKTLDFKGEAIDTTFFSTRTIDVIYRGRHFLMWFELRRHLLGEQMTLKLGDYRNKIDPYEYLPEKYHRDFSIQTAAMAHNSLLEDGHGDPEHLHTYEFQRHLRRIFDAYIKANKDV